MRHNLSGLQHNSLIVEVDIVAMIFRVIFYEGVEATESASAS